MSEQKVLHYADGVLQDTAEDFTVTDDLTVNDTVYLGGTATTNSAIDTDTTTDELKIGAGSGHGRQVVITDTANIAKDHDHADAGYPVLYVHSDEDPDTANNEWISVCHDGANAQIDCGTGSVEMPATRLTDDVFIGVSGTNRVAITQRTGAGTESLNFSIRDTLGRNIIVTDYDYRNRDHDHADSTDPTLFVHSATDPNTNNTQWVSLSHDQTDAVINWGAGTIDFAGGSVTAATVTHDEYWEVQIGGVAKKIMLGS